MADGFSYGGYYGAPYPYWLSPPFPYPPVSAPSFLTSNPVASYDLTQGVFDSMISQGTYQRSLAEWSNNPSYRENSLSGASSSSLYANNNRPGNCSQTGENMLSSYGLYSSREPSSDFVSLPTENFSERPSLDFVPISSYEEAQMLMKNIQEPIFTPIASSFDENRSGYYFPTSDRPGTMNVIPGSHGGEPYKDSYPPLPMPISKTQALFGGSQTGIHIGDGRSFSSNSNVCSHEPENLIGVQYSLHGSSIEPVNFNALIGYGEAAGHIKPFPKNPESDYRIVSSQGCRSPRSSTPIPSNVHSSISLIKDIEGSGVSSLYQRPCNLVADSKNGVSENSVKNLSCDEHRPWNHGMASSEGPSAPAIVSMGSVSLGATKANNENAKTAVNYRSPFEASTFQLSEDNQANRKSCKPQEQMLGIMYGDNKTTLLTDMSLNGSIRSNEDDVSTGRSPERHLGDQGDFPSSSSSPRVSSVINAMHNLSEVLVYECFNNGSWLKLDQLEYLDKVVDNLTKCLKKITGNKTVAGETSLPTQAMHVSCPNVFNLNEAPKVVAKDFQGFNVKPLDSCDMKEPVDKNEMTQGIKNILASNFLDSEENHPQTLLYKNLWLETEAALCSTSAMARYHRIKNEIGNLKLHDREISADASTSLQDPSLNTQTSVPIMNSEKQETTESLIKQRSNCVNNVLTISTDAPQSSNVYSDSVDAVISLMCQNFMGGLEQTIHGNLSPDAATSGKIPDAIQQESPASTTEDKHTNVIDRFQILKQRETNCILDIQNYPETKIGDQEDSEALKMADIGRSSHVIDVMDRFQILKRRGAEQVEKSLNIDTDSDSDIDEPSSETEMRDHLWSGSLIKIGGNSQIETCAADTEPSASGKGCESPTSDWEHVLKDH